MDILLVLALIFPYGSLVGFHGELHFHGCMISIARILFSFPLRTVILEIPFVFLVTVFTINFWGKKIPTFNNFIMYYFGLKVFVFFHAIDFCNTRRRRRERADALLRFWLNFLFMLPPTPTPPHTHTPCGKNKNFQSQFWRREGGGGRKGKKVLIFGFL